MSRSPSIRLAFALAWSLLLSIACFSTRVHAADYAPGDVIEYRVRGAFPEQWERGVIIRELDGGKQYLIHEKPSQFFPEGPEIARAPSDLRRPQTARQPAVPDVPAPPLSDERPAADGQGLLSRADVIRYARQLFGAGDPFAHPQREVILARIRDHIRFRGTNFLSDTDFTNQMSAIGAYSVHISSAIDANYGPAPKLEDYFGTFLLRTANRGSRSVARDGSRVVITTEDSQHESGALTIHEDGTYVWRVFRDDPPGKWLRGKWREVVPEEMHLWEGGAAIWLEKAKQGEDYMVRMCRVPGWPDWIDVGMGKGRTPVEYGRRAR